MCVCVCVYTHIHIYIERETERDSNLSQILFWLKAVKETEKVFALAM